MTMPKDEKPPVATSEELAQESGGRRAEPPMGVDTDTGGRLSGGISGWGRPFVAAIVIGFIIILSVVQANVGKFVTQEDFATNWQGMDNRVATAEVNIAKAKNVVDTAAANIPNQIQTAVNNANSQSSQQVSAALSQLQSATSQISGYAGQIANHSSQIEAANQKITALESKITTQQASIDALVTRVATLEKDESGGSGDTGAPAPFSVEAKATSKTFTFSATTNVTTVSFSTKVTLISSSAKDLEDIELEIPIEVSLDMLSGTGLITSWTESVTKWYMADKELDYSEAYVVLNGQDITLEANDTDKIYIPMTLYVNGEVGDLDIDMGTCKITDWGYE